jgi:O-acetyl-ADP-ribose deacetylase (regulator of RNase III)
MQGAPGLVHVLAVPCISAGVGGHPAVTAAESTSRLVPAGQG